MKMDGGKVIFLSKNDTTLKETKKNEWAIYNREEKFLGSVKRKDRVYHLYDSKGSFLGSILSKNEFRSTNVGVKTKERKVPKVIEVIEVIEVIDPVTKISKKINKKVKKTINEKKYSKDINPAKITPEAIKLYFQTLKSLDQIK